MLWTITIVAATFWAAFDLDPLIAVLAAAAAVAVMGLLIAGGTARANRRAKVAGNTLGALFSSTTTVHLYELVHAPQFASLEKTRLTFLTGGWVGGQLAVTSDGIVWTPTSRSRRLFRAPTLRLGWDEVEAATVTTGDLFGPGDPGYLELRLAGGIECAFRIFHRKELATALELLVPDLVAHPPTAAGRR